VIDCAGDSLLSKVGVTSGAGVSCYNSLGHKVYCTSSGHPDQAVTVVDGAGDSVLTTIPVGDGGHAICYNPLNNRVYTTNYLARSAVTVIDCAQDLVDTVIPVSIDPRYFGLDTLHNKLYCGCDNQAVKVIDCVGESLVKGFYFDDYPTRMAFDPTRSRMYVACGRSVCVLRDSVISGIEEKTQPVIADSRPMATVVHGILFLPKISSPSSSASLLDIGGRKVMNLQPGANDVRFLVPGVYFVREEPSAVGRKPSAVTVRKVVVTR